jgi:hypothetical protein
VAVVNRKSLILNMLLCRLNSLQFAVEISDANLTNIDAAFGGIHEKNRVTAELQESGE